MAEHARPDRLCRRSRAQDFEQHFAAYCGTAEAVGCGNGTDALHLSFRALGVGAGDEVVVPANTFVATVEAIVLAGASPVFVDVDPATLLITAEGVAAALTPRTRAVVAVHLYGHMPDMDALEALTAQHGLVLVEDAAQAHGATWNRQRAGSFGRVGCFSFYPGKNLGAFGDAGAVTTSDPEVAARIRAMQDHGRVGNRHYEHALLGLNSRLDALQAVVLDAKLERLDRWNAARRRIVKRYRALLPPDVGTLVDEVPGSRGAHHLAVIQVDRRDQVRERLAGVGVATGIHYPRPCHEMAPYRRYARGSLPVVERATADCCPSRCIHTCSLGRGLRGGPSLRHHRVAAMRTTPSGSRAGMAEIDPDVVVGYPGDRNDDTEVVLGRTPRLRSGTVLYAGSIIGDRFQTGHHVLVREQCEIGDDVSIWSNTVVDYGCRIGNGVKIHSNCYVAQYTEIEDHAFLAPGVTIANDLYPGQDASARVMGGPSIGAGAQIGVNVTLLPYVRVGAGCLIGAGSVVTRDLEPGTVAFGNPARPRGSVRDLQHIDTRLVAHDSSASRFRLADGAHG